ncbi:MAG: phosphoadenylyl-sulfate reductase [Bacteroidota bacterium]
MLSNDIQAQIQKTEVYLNRYQQEKKRVFVSSSFQTHSIPLLHILSSLDNSIPVYFLDTGFHFEETLDFRDHIGSLLGLDIISVTSPMSKIHQRDRQGRFFFCSDTDYCCHLNKVLPLEPTLHEFDIWITGVRRDQSKVRKQMDFEAKGPHGTTRFHPMLDWTSKMIHEYRKEFALPEHPLEKEGYLSVGCAPCTQKYLGDERASRWAGQNKVECGLHTELIEK